MSIFWKKFAIDGADKDSSKAAGRDNLGDTVRDEGRKRKLTLKRLSELNLS